MSITPPKEMLSIDWKKCGCKFQLKSIINHSIIKYSTKLFHQLKFMIIKLKKCEKLIQKQTDKGRYLLEKKDLI